MPQKAWDAYFAVWAQQGMDDPQVYFEALVAPVAGFVSPKGAAQLKDALWDKQRGGTELLTRPANLRGMRRAATEVFEAATETPVINVLMMSALYVIWIPALCLWVCARRSPRWIPLFIPCGAHRGGGADVAHVRHALHVAHDLHRPCSSMLLCGRRRIKGQARA